MLPCNPPRPIVLMNLSSSVLGSNSGKNTPAKSLPSRAISRNVEIPAPGAKPPRTERSNAPEARSNTAPVGSAFVQRS